MIRFYDAVTLFAAQEAAARAARGPLPLGLRCDLKGLDRKRRGDNLCSMCAFERLGEVGLDAVDRVLAAMESLP